MDFKYKKEYANISFNVLSKPLAREEELCLVFKCSPEILEKWKQENYSFLFSVQQGLLEGEIRLRKILLGLSFLPASGVNTKLLTLLASNVYRINEEQISIITQHTEVEDPEEIMRKRGIPIPEVGVVDACV